MHHLLNHHHQSIARHPTPFPRLHGQRITTPASMNTISTCGTRPARAIDTRKPLLLQVCRQSTLFACHYKRPAQRGPSGLPAISRESMPHFTLPYSVAHSLRWCCFQGWGMACGHPTTLARVLTKPWQRSRLPGLSGKQLDLRRLSQHVWSSQGARQQKLWLWERRWAAATQMEGHRGSEAGALGGGVLLVPRGRDQWTNDPRANDRRTNDRWTDWWTNLQRTSPLTVCNTTQNRLLCPKSVTCTRNHRSNNSGVVVPKVLLCGRLKQTLQQVTRQTLTQKHCHQHEQTKHCHQREQSTWDLLIVQHCSRPHFFLWYNRRHHMILYSAAAAKYAWLYTTSTWST